MRVDIMTLFPDSMRAVLNESIIGRAVKKGIVEINCVQIRDFTHNKQRQVDDYPYGGGWGVVMMAQPLKTCLDHIMTTKPSERSRVIYMSPQGKPFIQADALRLRDNYDHLVVVCGHYEGIDARFINLCVDEEISIGDFVLTGGEIPAMALTDAVCRLIPGVLADAECFTAESHFSGLLEYPQYTRPAVWEGLSVPAELLCGDHAVISDWRRKKSLELTADKRPDMLADFEPINETERKFLSELLRTRGFKPLVYDLDQRRADMGDLPDIMTIIRDMPSVMTASDDKTQTDNIFSIDDITVEIQSGNCWLFLCRELSVGMIDISINPAVNHASLISGCWLIDDGKYGLIKRYAIQADMLDTPIADEMLDFCEELCEGAAKTSLRMFLRCDDWQTANLLRARGYSRCGIALLLGIADKEPYRLAYEKLL